MKRLFIILFAMFQFVAIMAQSSSAQQIALTPKDTLDDRNQGVMPPDAWYNPQSNKIDITNVDNGTSLEIANEEGRVIYTGSLSGNTRSINTFSLPTLDKGVYTVKVESSQNEYEGEIDVN